MGKTVDASEILYRMGKYGEIDMGEKENESFKNFMLLLTRTIEKLPNTSLISENPIDDEIKNTQYKMTDAISLKTGKTRHEFWYDTWMGMTMQVRNLKIGESAGFRYIKDKDGHDFPGAMHTSYVTDYYISNDKKDLVVQTENTIFKFQKVEEEALNKVE